MTTELDALRARVDALERLLTRLLAALEERDASGYRTVGKALGTLPLNDREGYALSTILKRLGDRQL